MTRDEILQNKIYRAVHDGVCPSCGVDYEVGWTCANCGFHISHFELDQFRAGVVAWGREMKAYVQGWRENR